jgi:hypothetical protein
VCNEVVSIDLPRMSVGYHMAISCQIIPRYRERVYLSI